MIGSLSHRCLQAVHTPENRSQVDPKRMGRIVFQLSIFQVLLHFCCSTSGRDMSDMSALNNPTAQLVLPARLSQLSTVGLHIYLGKKWMSI